MSATRKNDRDPRTDAEAETRDRALGHYFVPERVARIANGTIPEFDIDPCAHPSQIIKARQLVVGSTLMGIDGFAMPWHGSCFLNPPNFKNLAKGVVSNYPFHSFEKWMNLAMEKFESGETDTLMVYSPARNGVTWYNNLVQKSTIHLVFHQRVNCLIGQRTAEGEILPPREMTSPFGGSSLFLFTRQHEVGDRFIKCAREEGVLQVPLALSPSVETHS